MAPDYEGRVIGPTKRKNNKLIPLKEGMFERLYERISQAMSGPIIIIPDEPIHTVSNYPCKCSDNVCHYCGGELKKD